MTGSVPGTVTTLTFQREALTPGATWGQGPLGRSLWPQHRPLATPRCHRVNLLCRAWPAEKCFASRSGWGLQEAPGAWPPSCCVAIRMRLSESQPHAAVRGVPCHRFYALGAPFDLFQEQGGLWTIGMCPPEARVPPSRSRCRCTGPWSPLVRHPRRGLTSPPPLCPLFLSWGVPLAITVAAVALKKIGYDASDVSVGWCWIDLEAEDRVLWMLLTGKLWEMLAYVTLPVLYFLIRKHINRAHEALSEYRPIVSEEHRLGRHASAADKKLVLIPLIFICLRVWSTVRFVLTLCGSPAVRWPVLVVLHGIGNTFQGGANCIMFVLCTRAVRARLFSGCRRRCPSQPPAQSPAGPPKTPASSETRESQGSRHTPDAPPVT
uniref:G protein-coupled receptor 157 n=1 Tax=Suricata suricatta TaxID=37032 RepID=A0A673TDX4_SURSU